MKVYLLEAVDPEDRNLRLAKIRAYMKRNKGAFEMTPTSDPHAQTHYFARYAHAARILAVKRIQKPGWRGLTRRILARGDRLNRMDLRKAQAKAQKKAKKSGQAVVKHAADKLTSTGAWMAMRKFKGLDP